MSGRKASEVNSLLNNGEKTRKLSIDILNSIHTQAVNTIENADKKRNEILAKLDNMKSTVSDEVHTEFPEIAEELEKECELLKNSFKSKKIDYDVNTVNLEYAKINNEYKNVDLNAEKIRNSIQQIIRSQGRSDPWYCDREYAQANNVQKEYKRLSNKAAAFKNQCSTYISNANVAVSDFNEILNHSVKLSEDIEAIEKKAKDIVKMREQASELKTVIEKSFNDIDSNIAIKFLEEEYKALKSEIEQFIKLEDKKVIANYKNMLTNVETYKNELNKRYSEYLQRQGAVNAQITSLQERLNNKIYTHPTDEFKKISEKQKHTLSEFLSQYAKGKYVGEINKLMNEVTSLFKNDKFDEAEININKLNSLVSQASDFAANKHECMMKTIDSMLRIKQAMLGLNYDVTVTKNTDIDDGYCIECKVGDESIKFDKVTVDDNGKPIIDIYHHESVSGTCAKPWGDIRKQIAEQGIFIEDITKNGVSINEGNRIAKVKGTTQGVSQNK